MAGAREERGDGAGGDAPTPSRGPGRPRKESYESRGDRLVDAAVTVFATHGAGASVDLIAEHAGVNKALVYQHVASKQELFTCAVERERDRLAAYVARLQADPVGGPVEGRARVRGQFHAFLDFAAAHPTSLALLSLPEAAAHLDGSGRAAITASVASNLRETLHRRGLPDGAAPEVLASMLVGMAGAVMRSGVGERWDAEAVVDLLTDFTIGGLASLDADLLARLERPGLPPT